jgi:hypothetical protein
MEPEGWKEDRKEDRPPKSFSPDRHRSQTQSHLILGGFAILLVVGGLFIWWMYGAGAAFTGVTCLLIFMVLFGLLFGILKLMELWARDD